MRYRLFAFAAALAALASFGGAAHGQPYYQGKTLRIIVGLAPGGGFDTYARVIGRHIGKHVPGNPTVIVDNMPGAGSITMTNHLYKVAKPDGLTLGHFNGAIILGQVLGQAGIEFDARKLEYVGAPIKEDVACSLTRKSGVTSMQQWAAAKAPLKIGGVAPGATPDNAANILKAALGLPIQVVTGFKGTSPIRLAVESGELAGGCWSWESMRVTWRAQIEAGDVVPVVQIVAKAFADIPSVPLATSFAKTPEARRLIEVGVQNSSAIARPFALSPGTPKEHVQALRQAFEATLKDPEFLAEATKAKMTIDLVSGEQLASLVADVFSLDSATRDKLKAALYPK
jgi:tripartite-type tricarboxylate transporter receptor subunit TctC